MPYVGGSLTSLFGKAAQEATRRVPGRIVHRGADRMHDVAAMNTPVRTGNLRTAWYQLPVVPLGSGATGGIANDVEYAPYVEYGTGTYGPKHRPYTITPKQPGGVLAWRDPKTGHWVYATKVEHPGSPGNHMLAIAGHIVEGELISGALAQPVLEEWQRIVEGAAH